MAELGPAQPQLVLSHHFKQIVTNSGVMNKLTNKEKNKLSNEEIFAQKKEIPKNKDLTKP